MGEHLYHEWFKSPEPCPAIYIHLTRPSEQEPFLLDILGAIDTGAPLTVLPLEYKDRANLIPAARRRIRWSDYEGDRPTYMAIVTAEELKPRLVEILFDEHCAGYALIGRNLMKHWRVMLNGPEQVLQIREP